MSGPGIAAVTIFSLLYSYNEYLVASIFLRDEEKMTIPVGVQMFMEQFQAVWGGLMAAATLAMLPTVVFPRFVQKSMVYGAVAGSVKGLRPSWFLTTARHINGNPFPWALSDSLDASVACRDIP